jgi:hypothetical protein
MWTRHSTGCAAWPAELPAGQAGARGAGAAYKLNYKLNYKLASSPQICFIGKRKRA